MAEEGKPALPPYPEMILAAIDALNEKKGSSKSRIAKFIESKHGDLPAGHSMLISHHLNKMKDAGEVVFSKNNYLRSDPGSPPKRGRGRPPKAKEPLPTGLVPPPPKPRGRPPKPKDPLAAAVAKASEGLPKRRGRPPKKSAKLAAVSAAAKPEKPEKAAPSPTTAKAASTTSVAKRGRGRPPKAKPAVAAVGA